MVRSGPPIGTVSVSYGLDGDPGTATGGGVDYTLGGTGTLTFGAGITSMPIPVTIKNDTIMEGDETVRLKLFNPTPANLLLGNQTTAVLTIQDNDVGGVIQFSAAAYTVAENVSGGLATITVVRTAPPAGKTLAGPVMVNYAVTGGTATGGGVDYTLADGTLTFNAGVTSQTFKIAIFNDTGDELDETINLMLSNPTGGATLGTQSTAVVTITDNDLPGTVDVRKFNGIYAGTFTGTFTLPGTTVCDTFPDGTPDGKCTITDVPLKLIVLDGKILVAVPDAGLGTLSPTSQFQFKTKVAEGIGVDCGFTGGGQTLPPPATAGGPWICNFPGVIEGSGTWEVTRAAVGMSNAFVIEGNTGTTDVTLTVMLAEPHSETVTINYATADGPSFPPPLPQLGATAPNDYIATSGVLTFQPGETVKTLIVKVKGDTVKESIVEFFNVNMSSSTFPDIPAVVQGMVTILDND